jgi:hypothetical protein
VPDRQYGVSMDGRSWSFLRGLGPVRRAVRDEVERTVEPIMRSAREALDTHRRALGARDELVADLRTRNDGLRKENDELRERVSRLEADNADLRAALEQPKPAERSGPGDHQPRSPERTEPAPRGDISSDLFCCLDCSSLWLLTTWPDRIQTVCRPIGDGCRTCSDQPLRRLRAAKASVTKSGAVAGVARPSTPTSEGGKRTVGFAAELLRDGSDAAIAWTVARKASELARTRLDRIAPADRCEGLSAMADGIDREPKPAGDQIAWCATGIPGAPEVSAKVLSEIASLAMLEPADRKAIAREIRLVGAASCAVENALGTCRCARKLAGPVR